MAHRLIVAAVVCCMAGVTAPDADLPPPAQPEARPAVPPESWLRPEWSDRLSDLDPSDPIGYFELAEAMADEAVGDPDLVRARADQARVLAAIAFAIDEESGWKHGLGASACLLLARLERRDEVKRWLRATAATLDQRYARPGVGAGVPRVPDDLAYKAASALGLARSGEGLDAIALLAEEPVRALILEYEPLLGDTGGTGGYARLESAARAWPCPECRNRRAVTRMLAEGPRVRLCNTCVGNPGPTLSPAELAAQLRFESRLLAGIHTLWSAQVMADGGAPLLDPDPSQVVPTLQSRHGFDATRRRWQAGAWHATP